MMMPLLKKQNRTSKKRIGTPLKFKKEVMEDPENRAALEDLNREI